MNIALLGAGMVGSAMAIDLAKSGHQVTAFDRSETALQALKQRQPGLRTQAAHLTDYASYAQWLAPYDLVVQALPGFMGFAALEAVISAGKNVVDISFFPEDAQPLHTLALEKQVSVITDCGVAPGMSNLLLGYACTQMDVQRFEAVVGGLPQVRTKPYEYKAPFSPVDVLEEYTRPARYREHGINITKPALTDVEMLQFPGIGTLEAFNTDGLRSLLSSFPAIATLKEKTLRYPGHAALIQTLLDSGFLSQETVYVNGQATTPLAFNGRLLIDQWKLGPQEPELTVMRVLAEGFVAGKMQLWQWDLLDKYHIPTHTSSMARTTGYTCTAAVALMQNGKIPGPGLWLPERIGALPGALDFVLKHLSERGVYWCKTEKNSGI